MKPGVNTIEFALDRQATAFNNAMQAIADGHTDGGPEDAHYYAQAELRAWQMICLLGNGRKDPKVQEQVAQARALHQRLQAALAN